MGRQELDDALAAVRGAASADEIVGLFPAIHLGKRVLTNLEASAALPLSLLTPRIQNSARGHSKEARAVPRDGVRLRPARALVVPARRIRQ